MINVGLLGYVVSICHVFVSKQMRPASTLILLVMNLMCHFRAGISKYFALSIIFSFSTFSTQLLTFDILNLCCKILNNEEKMFGFFKWSTCLHLHFHIPGHGRLFNNHLVNLFFNLATKLQNYHMYQQNLWISTVKITECNFPVKRKTIGHTHSPHYAFSRLIEKLSDLHTLFFVFCRLCQRVYRFRFGGLVQLDGLLGKGRNEERAPLQCSATGHTSTQQSACLHQDTSCRFSPVLAFRGNNPQICKYKQFANQHKHKLFILYLLSQPKIGKAWSLMNNRFSC